MSQRSTLASLRDAAAPLPGWPVSHPRLAAVACALAPVLFASLGFGAGQAMQLPDERAYLLAGAAMLLGGLVGLRVMGRARPTLAEFGIRRPVLPRSLLGLAPLVVAVLVVLLSGGVSTPAALVPGYLLVAAGAALSEEVWYRGLVLSVLRPRGIRYAVVGQALMFAVLHLANLANGKSVTYAVLQLLFAALFGLVAGQLVVLSGSLWPAIAWHFAHDLVSYLGGDELGTRQVVGLAVCIAVLAAYAAHLWRRLPR